MRPFVEEVPRLLQERNLSLRALARKAGVADSHLSRVLRQVDYKSPGPDLARKVALALDLPEDYFPEFREAFVLERVRCDPRLREQLYKRLRNRTK
jgi:transcriptional regulator with XRE-family HTH domain